MSKEPKTYSIKFDVEGNGKAINAVQVKLFRHLERNMATAFHVNLADDPLYPALCEYVKNNPPRS